MESSSELKLDNTCRFLRSRKLSITLGDGTKLEDVKYEEPDTLADFHWVHHPVKGLLRVHSQQVTIVV